MKDLIDLKACSAVSVEKILHRAAQLKEWRRAGLPFQPLRGKSVVLYFEKPSLRTRVSFEVGIHEMGGTVTYLDQSMAGLGTREAVKDVVRTLEHYVNGVVCRVFHHALLYELSRWSDKLSVVNALSDFSHPCQILADVQALRDAGLWREGLTLTWVGDPNNVLESWIELAHLFPITIRVSCPELPARYDDLFYDPELQNRFFWIRDPHQAVAEADVIYADTWVSMGQEEEGAAKKKYFEGYTIDEALIRSAPPHVRLLHCLPAKRDEEVTDSVFEQFRDIIFTQAENRLHVQKAILWTLLAPHILNPSDGKSQAPKKTDEVLAVPA
jgi:ornithine carbamoyltransferase